MYTWTGVIVEESIGNLMRFLRIMICLIADPLKLMWEMSLFALKLPNQSTDVP